MKPVDTSLRERLDAWFEQSLPYIGSTVFPAASRPENPSLVIGGSVVLVEAWGACGEPLAEQEVSKFLRLADHQWIWSHVGTADRKRLRRWLAAIGPITASGREPGRVGGLVVNRQLVRHLVKHLKPSQLAIAEERERHIIRFDAGRGAGWRAFVAGMAEYPDRPYADAPALEVESGGDPPLYPCMPRPDNARVAA
ncbi:MAG TPA: hypothetical protein VF746_13215 [Longimicrobium sp.]|jgi:hypothetical protein